jgi:bifunctional enzyme CysN/CysC
MATVTRTGTTVWLTGLPASGKTTIGSALVRALVEDGRPAYLLDGDELRRGLSSDLGFAPADRAEHIRRAGHVARLFADAGLVAVVGLISPLAEARARVRAEHYAAGVPFTEVHVHASPEECARRDPKGLYAKARTGELEGFTGVDAPYEAPTDPDLRIDTEHTRVQDAVAEILARLPPGVR